MALPTTIDELRQQNYKYSGDSECKACGADIEWWETPRGKKIPMNHGTAIAHWSTCPNVADFRANRDEPLTSKITTATLNMDWLKQQAAGCHCVVCKKITGRS